jgi:hypothetical protein
MLYEGKYLADGSKTFLQNAGNHKNTQRHNPEDHNHNFHHRENLKFHTGTTHSILRVKSDRFF